MARKIVALILGLLALGLVTGLLLFTKEADVGQATLEFYVGEAPPRDLSSHVPITVDANDEVRLDGRTVELTELADEIAIIVREADAAGDGLPDFSLAVHSTVDNAIVVEVMMAVVEGGGATIALAPDLDSGEVEL